MITRYTSDIRPITFEVAMDTRVSALFNCFFNKKTLYAVLATTLFFGSSFTNAKNSADQYQRYITFKNDFNFRIYPVIQVPSDLCDGKEHTNSRRIFVNSGSSTDKTLGNGLAPNEMVTVLLPNESKTVLNKEGKPEVKRCWYAAGRIYIFTLDIHQFEKKMIELDPNNAAMQTKFDDPMHPRAEIPCFNGTMQDRGNSGICYSGLAKNSFVADVPAQLAEYTFDSDNANEYKDPDTGIPMADIDVSNVDDLYLPVTASVYNHGATGYMGSAMKLEQYKDRLNRFIGMNTSKPIWPIYSAYLNDYWKKNAFYSLMPDELGGNSQAILPHLPGGYNAVNNDLVRATSAIYIVDKVADGKNFLISGVQTDPNGPNPIVQPYLDKWMSWVNGNPCSSIKDSDWPANITKEFNKDNFCKKFQITVKEVWTHFLTDPADGYNNNQDRFLTECNLQKPISENKKNACIIQHIVGYNSKILGGKLPAQVQALLRGVAFEPQNGAQQYQFDPFLLFAMPYDSQFNLDPYTRFIHDETIGIGAVAYSFSIDDKYGNFRDAASGFILNAGGNSALENKSPFDPYQQYKAGWGYNLYKMSVVVLAPLDAIPSVSELQKAAEKFNGRPILMKQRDSLMLFGQVNGAWKVTHLITQIDLEALARKEKKESKTIYFQELYNHLFAENNIFPKQFFDPKHVDEKEVAILEWDADTTWNLGKAKLYELIVEKKAHQDTNNKNVNNWVKASICGTDLNQISGPGNHSLSMPPIDGGGYKPCDLIFTDKLGNNFVFQMGTTLKQVKDTYTGAMVTVRGFKTGTEHSGDPKITSNLDASDLQYCKQHSSSPVKDLCNAANVSAVWSGDPFARDTVYMGLAFEDMPRVNFNLPPAIQFNPNAVYWPDDTVVTAKVKDDDHSKVEFTWTAAKSNAGNSLLYYFTFPDGAPAQCVGSDGFGIPDLSCVVTVKPDAKVSYTLMAVDYKVREQAELKGTFDPSTPTPILNWSGNLSAAVNQDAVVISWETASAQNTNEQPLYTVTIDGKVICSQVSALSCSASGLTTGVHTAQASVELPNLSPGGSHAPKTTSFEVQTNNIPILNWAGNLSAAVDKDAVILSWEAATTKNTNEQPLYTVVVDDKVICSRVALLSCSASGLAKGTHMAQAIVELPNLSPGGSHPPKSTAFEIQPADEPILNWPGNLSATVNKDAVVIAWEAAATQNTNEQPLYTISIDNKPICSRVATLICETSGLPEGSHAVQAVVELPNLSPGGSHAPKATSFIVKPAVKTAPVIADACRAGRTQKIVIQLSNPIAGSSVTVFFNDGSSVSAGIPSANGKITVNALGDKTVVNAVYAGSADHSNTVAITPKGSADCTYP